MPLATAAAARASSEQPPAKSCSQVMTSGLKAGVPPPAAAAVAGGVLGGGPGYAVEASAATAAAPGMCQPAAAPDKPNGAPYEMLAYKQVSAQLVQWCNGGLPSRKDSVTTTKRQPHNNATPHP